jgi:3-hydroxybutyryl-CoA dehydrogenase
MGAGVSRPAGERMVGVVGAGTMGAGIAQVAAAAGHPVRLLDARPGAAAAARAQIAAALSKLVEKGKIEAHAADELLARIVAVDALGELAAAAIVIEVIFEDLAAKQGLLRELEDHVASDAVLASNTSTISITAMAQGMRNPERVVGMHFFNPVPQMKLVEVVSGADTSSNVAGDIFELARRWGKTPVHAKSTPGFIVNRIARPFYAEALQLLLEQAGTPAQLDECARGAGFRMGPCELMDLIGHDINYAVTQSVFNATYGDRRFQPSMVQKALVDGGRLGRKAGKGFYEGAEEGSVVVAAAPPSVLEVHGDSPMARQLARILAGRSIGFNRVEGSDWNGLLIDGIQMHLTDGRCAAQVAAQRRQTSLGVIDWPLGSNAGALAIAFAPGVDAGAQSGAGAALAACGWQPRILRDVAGLLVARTVAMLINEASDAVWQGVCDQDSVDQAMRLGTNYPMGPFEWLALVGADATVVLLDNLDAAYRGERYRVSPLLRQRYWTERIAA